jgi:hypothetical protein
MKNSDSQKTARSARSVTDDTNYVQSESDSNFDTGFEATDSSKSTSPDSLSSGPWAKRAGFISRIFNPFRRSEHLLDQFSFSEADEYATPTDAWTDPVVRIVIYGLGLVLGIEVTAVLLVLTPYTVPGTVRFIFAAYPFIGLVGVVLFFQPLAALWVASVVRAIRRGVHRLCLQTAFSWFSGRER